MVLPQHSNIQRARMTTILTTILKHKRVTRSKLAALTKLSQSSIIKYIQVMIGLGLVRETTRDVPESGRGSLFLECDPDVGLNIAIVLGLGSVQGSLVNSAGEIVKSVSAPAYKNIPKDDLMRCITEVIRDLHDYGRGLEKKIFGIGVGLGGFMDPRKGISHQYLYSRGWEEVPIKDLVEREFGLPCFLINDANATALGEKYYGRGIGVDNFLCVWMGEGIGMGVFVNGELYNGETDYAGEFGHTRCVADGALCYCGHVGCLETVTSQGYILARCREGLLQGVHSEIGGYALGNPEDLRIEHVIDAANNGDRFTRNILENVAAHIGGKLSDVANLLNPELIILRGPVIDGNRFLFDNIKRIVDSLSLRPIAEALRIEYAERREDMQTKGIGAYILTRYFT